MKGSLIVIVFFCVGCIMGVFNKFQFDTHTVSMYILYALMLQVGISIGSNKNLKAIISHLHPKMLLIPLGTIPRHRYEKFRLRHFLPGVVLRLIRHLYRWVCAIDLIRHGFLVLHSNDSSPVARCFHAVLVVLFRRQSLRGQWHSYYRFQPLSLLLSIW